MKIAIYNWSTNRINASFSTTHTADIHLHTLVAQANVA